MTNLVVSLVQGASAGSWPGVVPVSGLGDELETVERHMKALCAESEVRRCNGIMAECIRGPVLPEAPGASTSDRSTGVTQPQAPTLSTSVLLRLLRLISSAESAMLMADRVLPDHLVEETGWAMDTIESAILYRAGKQP